MFLLLYAMSTIFDKAPKKKRKIKQILDYTDKDKQAVHKFLKIDEVTILRKLKSQLKQGKCLWN